MVNRPYRANRIDRAANALAERKPRLLAQLGVLCALAGALGTGSPAAAATGRPVVIVCGMYSGGGPTACVDFMTPLETYLESQSIDAYIVDSGASNDNYARAEMIAAEVDRVLSLPQYVQGGVTQVDLIGHSMGGVSARHYIKYVMQGQKVHTFISLGTGHRGNDLACFAPGHINQQCSISNFTLALNAGDDTPYGVDEGGTIRWNTLWVPFDETFTPSPSGHLDGGACFVRINDPQLGDSWEDHIQEPHNPQIRLHILYMLHGVCTGTFTELPIQ